MKFNRLALVAGFFASSVTIAADFPSSISNVDVFKTDSAKLSIQNLSQETVNIDVYGEVFELVPSSGLSFECAAYSDLELLFKDTVHDFFEVPCKSRVVINEHYQNSY